MPTDEFESGLPSARDHPEIDYHNTDECMPIVYFLGLISIDWNLCEHWFGTLIWGHFDQFEMGMAVTAKLGNQSRADLLLTLARQFETDSDVLERIEFAAKAFNRLREIRNILIHSHSITEHESGKLEWRRTSTTAPLGHTGSLADLKDIGLVHQAISSLCLFIIDLSTRYIALDSGIEPRPLPEIFPLPDKLTQLPPEDHPSD